MDRINQLLEFLKHDPSDTFVLYSLAQEYIKGGDLAKGLDYFTKLKALDPEYVGLYYHLGKLYETLGQPDHAILTYKEGIQVARTGGDTHAAGELAGALQLLEATLD